MAYYGVIFPEFWTGRTGRELRGFGKDAQLLGLYLATNRHANMIGLYQLLIDDIRHETGIGVKGIERGFTATSQTSFAEYDAASKYVWVRSMVRFRLGLKVGEGLSPQDNKVAAANKIYLAIDPNPFLGEFYDINRRALHLRRRREPFGLVVPFGAHHQMSGFEGASKGLVSQDQETGSGDQDQVQERTRLTPLGTGKPKAIKALVMAVVRQASPDLTFTDLKDLSKQACAEQGLPYDADAIGSALEQALARKAKAS